MASDGTARGRPPAILPGGEVEKRLLEALSLGAPIRIACGYAGCGADAYYAACARDPDFAERATRTRHQAAIRNLALIAKAAPDDWKAAAKALELMFPQDFNVSRQQVELTGKDGGPIQVEPVRERLAGELDRLAERQRQALPAVHPNGKGS